MKRTVFITGGTGYLGSRLIPLLTQRGHVVRALTRKNPTGRLPAGTMQCFGDALAMNAYTEHVRGADTFIHLIGVAHPSPAKAKEFREVDLVSAQVAVAAACAAGVKHFIYLSVAQPAPIMREYLAVRAECENLIRASGLAGTFVRPFYVLGPGHRWPYLVLPLFWLGALLPATRAGARRLAPVTLPQTLATLAWAVENPAQPLQILDASRIRNGGVA